MKANLTTFLSGYSNEVITTAMAIREIVLHTLPNVTEQVDLPARMIAYCYGHKYSEMVCSLIPSKKGIKLSFYKGTGLPDPEGLLQGTGKISRYIEIKDISMMHASPVEALLKYAYIAYLERMKQ